MLCVTGPGVRVVVTDAAAAVLRAPGLPTVLDLLAARGAARGTTAHLVEGIGLRLVPAGGGWLVLERCEELAA